MHEYAQNMFYTLKKIENLLYGVVYFRACLADASVSEAPYRRDREGDRRDRYTASEPVTRKSPFKAHVQ